MMSGTETIDIDVGGRVYTAKGTLRVGVGRCQRHAVPGGFTEQPTAQFVEGSVAFGEPIRGDVLRSMDGVTVTYSEASGWRFTLHNAWVEYANDGARPNQYEIKVVGETRD